MIKGPYVFVDESHALGLWIIVVIKYKCIWDDMYEMYAYDLRLRRMIWVGKILGYDICPYLIFSDLKVRIATTSNTFMVGGS